MALYNCAMISTKDIGSEYSRPFCFMMDALMCGTGVGFDTSGAGSLTIKERSLTEKTVFVIPDSREGWVESLKLLLDSFFVKDGLPVLEFDYSEIRKRGELIKGFGGVSSGYAPLKELHDSIVEICTRNAGNSITVTNITDIMNLIGKTVVAGNIRRSAQLALGPTTDEYLDLKNYEVNPQRSEWGWCSNNSILATLGMDYSDPARRTAINGEPGYIWLENAKTFGRMGDVPDYKDNDVVGFNPCVEIPLGHGETCNLCETFPNKHDSVEDYLRTLKYAYLYAKTITLKPTHWPETNRAMLRNRRLGISMSGIAQFLSDKGLHALKSYCEDGYDELKRLDEIYSAWLCVPTSRRLTTLKPSGSVSLLAGATPGVHFPEDRFYIRRVRIASGSEIEDKLRSSGYYIEPDVKDPKNTLVVEIPIDIGPGVKILPETNIWEQLAITAFIQKYWSDNGVSATITFRQEEADQIPSALEFYQYQLKAISFLPKTERGAFDQMPYESITEKAYNDRIKHLSALKFNGAFDNEDSTPEMYCNNDSCTIL